MRVNAFLRFIASNLGWMTGSIVTALVIWVAANMANNPVEQGELADVPVQVRLPDGFVITEQPADVTVTAVVRAASDQWDLLVPGDVLVTADLSDKQEPDTYRVELEAEIASPLRGSVVALRPSSWTLTIDRQAEARFPIQVVVTQDPPLGYTYPPDLTCETTEVVVKGSAEQVDAVDRVEARLNLSDNLNPVTLDVNLTAVRANGLRATDVTLDPAAVTCPVDIQVHEGITPVEVLPDRGRTNPPSGYTFQGYRNITPERVGVTGDSQAIENMHSVVRTVPIDLTDQTETFTTEVPLALPDGVSSVPENQLVRVTVIINPVIDNREFQDVPVEVTGLDTTLYRVSGLATTVTVNVSGPQVELGGLEAGDLRVLVDLSGLLPGNHQVRPQATIIGQDTDIFDVGSVLPEQLSVTIEALNPTPTPMTTGTDVATPSTPVLTPTATESSSPR
jgi:YbbR domain-containing protein